MSKGDNLPKRSLGSSGLQVSALGFGCMSLSGVYGKSSDEEGIALIREALDRGITLLDTSDAYGAGHNEQLVGKAIAGRRCQDSAISAGATANSPTAVPNSSSLHARRASNAWASR